jgi:dihydroorotase
MEFTIANSRLLDGSIVDVVVANGVISEIGNGLNKGKKIDAGKSLLIPGLVDLHTHLREPGREDSETVATGSMAAAKGGFTAISAMANTFPVADTAGVVEQVFRLGQEAGF